MQSEYSKGKFIEWQYFWQRALFLRKKDCSDVTLLTKCKKCDAIFWLTYLEETGSFNGLAEDYSEWKDAELAEFLSIDDNFKALDIGLASDREEELCIRQQIQWAFNDPYRDSEGSALKNDARFLENINAIMTLLDTNDIQDCILLAELHRYQGEFDICMKIMNESVSEDFDWLKDEFRRECELGNEFVFKINT